MLKDLHRHGMEHRLDALILDLIHASEYLWDVGTALYGEKGALRIDWIKEKLYTLLEGKVGYLIGGLRQRLTKNQERLTPPQKKALEKTITYFENHRHMRSRSIAAITLKRPRVRRLVNIALGAQIQPNLHRRRQGHSKTLVVYIEATRFRS